MYKHILVPTDGSDLSRAAGASAVKLARALGARVTAFFVAPPPTPLIYEGLLPARVEGRDEDAAYVARTAARYLEVIQRACAKAEVPYRGVHVTDESPAEAIVAAAKKYRCDLIHMGSHGRRGLTGVLLGSQTHKVLAQSGVPVLVHRPAAPPRAANRSASGAL